MRPALGGRAPSTLLAALEGGRALDSVVPRVLEILATDPLASGGRFAGDLLRALTEVDAHFWSRQPRLYGQYREAVRAGALARLHLPPERRLDFWLERGARG